MKDERWNILNKIWGVVDWYVTAVDWYVTVAVESHCWEREGQSYVPLFSCPFPSFPPTAASAVIVNIKYEIKLRVWSCLIHTNISDVKSNEQASSKGEKATQYQRI